MGSEGLIRGRTHLSGLQSPLLRPDGPARLLHAALSREVEAEGAGHGREVRRAASGAASEVGPCRGRGEGDVFALRVAD